MTIKKSIVKWMLTALLTTVLVTFAYGLVNSVLAQIPSPTAAATPSSQTPSQTAATTSSPQIPSPTAAATPSSQTQSGTPAKFSGQALAIALGGVLVFYSITVWWVSWDNNYNFTALWIKPVALTAGHLGKASLSNFQIFGFTLVVLLRLLYTLASSGVLSGLSNDILLLLGISAVGTTGSKVVALGNKRLTFSNWAWLRNHEWLTIGEKGYEKKPELEDAKWSDLIKSGGSFDVYSFQLLGFSLLVAAELLVGIGSDLATFTLPQNFLSILGLSNVVYLGGKVTDPKSYEELNQKIDELRTEETDLISQYPNIQPESYGKYIAKARIVAEMLRSFYDQKGTFGGKCKSTIEFSKLMPNIPQKEPQFQPAITK
ncbi:hypothetical protein [Microcystis aeruginosa]|uniref:hypothetical protein n=1 Tax=Microcystis aeruginosa TaxID=1126 RepID=UPI000A65B576|nr:hypothetical protein [Microcystis aeruginosa]